ILQTKIAYLMQSVNHLGQMLNSLSYKNVLARGYAIVRDDKKQIISRADGAVPASVEFADGVVAVQPKN
ncbi:MAG: exodeoxyribonuclease VII large subunit, partial [Proteobacteria bacterium]|nr:exodeoxyribonuclease VII large subunit [Candidatus Enterousia avistercoris]